MRSKLPTQMLSRYFDQRFDLWVVKVFPGTQYVSNEADEMLVTTLGSCVSACVRDTRTGMSGMNHFMLPGNGNADWDGDGFSLRFGDFAMESLLNTFYSMGARKQDLIVKLFGGGNVTNFKSLIGDRNAEFAVNFLTNENIEVTSSDLGGTRARRIHFYPKSGKVDRKFVENTKGQQNKLIAQEEQYHKSLATKQAEYGSVELFEPQKESEQ